MRHRLIAVALALGACRHSAATQPAQAVRAGAPIASAPAQPPPPPPAHHENTILNLFDAFGAKIPGTSQVFGYSVLIRYADRTILFDAGSSADVLEKNVRALGVDLGEVDFAVASHSHFDHTSGFDYLLEVNPGVKILRGELGVRNVAPSHCTGHLGFELFQEAYGEHYHLAGLGARIPFPPAASPGP